MSICIVSEFTVIPPCGHGVLDGVILMIEILLNQGYDGFVDHKIWMIIWHRVEQFILIQKRGETWNLVSREAVNLLFSCFDRLLSKASQIELMTKIDSIVISVAKQVVEFCPNVLKVCNSVFEHDGIDRRQVSKTILISSLLTKLRYPKESNGDDELDRFQIFSLLHLWKNVLESLSGKDKDDVLEIVFKNIPSDIDKITKSLNRSPIDSENILYIMTQFARSGKKRHLAWSVKMLLSK